jgi:hypothetical protein
MDSNSRSRKRPRRRGSSWLHVAGEVAGAIEVDAFEWRRLEQRLQAKRRGFGEPLSNDSSRVGLTRRIGQGGRHLAHEAGAGDRSVALSPCMAPRAMS